jgi:rsbT co-antagonist protein RsbR
MAESSAQGHDRVAELEEQLREQTATAEKQMATLQVFSQLLDTASVIVWAVDPAGTYTLFDGKGLGLFGLNSGELVGESALERQGASSDVSSAISKALAGETTRLMTSPRADVHLDSWFMPLYLHDGTVGAMGLSIDASERVNSEQEVREKLELITRQNAMIRALTTPIIQVWDDVLCLPIIGAVDGDRAAEMMQRLLEAVAGYRVRYAIVDLTGVEGVDTSTADHVIQLLRPPR